jgi:hypothetical protein
MAKRPLFSSALPAVSAVQSESSPEPVTTATVANSELKTTGPSPGLRGVHISIRAPQEVKDRIDEMMFHRRHERPKVTATSLIIEALNLLSEKSGLPPIAKL